MNFFARFKSLPVSTRKLLGLGIILALAFGLPLFVWAIVSQKFLFSQKASTNTVPLNIQESFTGTGMLNSSNWNWSGVAGGNSLLESDKLKVSVPSGSYSVGNRIEGNDATTQALVNYDIPSISGPFDVSVDVVGFDPATATLSAGLKFAPGVIIQRTAGGSLIQVLTSPNNSIYSPIASYTLPEGTGSVRLRLLRTDQDIQAYYDTGSGYVLLSTITDQNYVSAVDTLPRIRLQNEPPSYPAGSAYFDNYSATANMIVQETPSPIPMPTPTPAAATAGECQMCGGIAGITCISNLVCPLSIGGPSDQTSICVKPDGSSNCFASPSPSPSTPPSPSPSPNVPISQSFTVRVRFAGVNNESADGAKITLRFENPSRFFDYTTNPFGLEYIGDGIYQADLVFGSAVPPLTADNHYAIYVKGEKHLASKFCQQTGQTVRCTGVGNIIIPPATSNPASYVLDFSGLPLEPGDLSPQDGAANTNDFAKITALLIKPHSALTAQDLMVGDLNYDGYVNILDAFLMRQTLQTRYDEN